MNDRSLVEYAQDNQYEGKPRGYLETYDMVFSSIRGNNVRLLELGVATGKSMLMWRDYFPNGTIVGVDLAPTEVADPRIYTYIGKQNDIAMLTKIAEKHAPDGFDIIIDDCSHIGELAKISFWHLFENHLRAGGRYCVEDWGTGYWGRHICYPDGNFFDQTERETVMHRAANKLLKQPPMAWPKLGPVQRLFRRYQYTRRFKVHDYGMAGFVKQFIDELAIAEITNSEQGVKFPTNPPAPRVWSRFKEVLYTPGIAIVTKR